jgi:CRISPR-associated endonuclease/helicase Cas3
MMGNRFDKLLAKSPVDRGRVHYEETLLGHTRLVCDMAEVISEMLAPRVSEAFGCSLEEAELWKIAVRFGAWMHDWGKANSHFQEAVRNPRSEQGIRHETVSLLISMELGDWLNEVWKTLPPWVGCAALFSVTGHHLKFPDPYFHQRGRLEVTFFTGHEDFASVLALQQRRLGLPVPPTLTDCKESLLRSGNISKRLQAIQRDLDLEFSHREKCLIAATKSVVMAADLAGSALPHKVENPEKWISDRLSRFLDSRDVENVVHSKLRGREPHQFQLQISQGHARTTLVEAGCGSGKTAAAYLWAARRAHGKRLYFCYPTTGTASEGFGGYLADPDFDAILIHSRSKADYRLLENFPNPSHEESDLMQARLEALETWPIPAVVCTAHTVLGLLENVRRGIYAFPSIMQAVFVFDEIHAYSNRLFSYLLRFLEVFTGIPVLLMTATLPIKRKRALEEVCQRRGGLETIVGPSKRERSPRYVLERASLENAWQRIMKSLESNEKILWVSNTVDRVMTRLDEALHRGIPVEPYHSRYRYKDRLVRHRSVVEGFRNTPGAFLAVTTQVAEMSLDLSADLLVTDVAPVAALIQRLGRLNRFEETPLTPRRALFIEPESYRPYDSESMSGVTEWINIVADGRPKSQRDLATAFLGADTPTTNVVEPAAYCEWLDGLWHTLRDQRAIQEASSTVEIVREEDVNTGPSVELAIPMPVPHHAQWRGWKRCGRYFVAPTGSIHYDPFRGARWK